MFSPEEPRRVERGGGKQAIRRMTVRKKQEMARVRTWFIELYTLFQSVGFLLGDIHQKTNVRYEGEIFFMDCLPEFVVVIIISFLSIFNEEPKSVSQEKDVDCIEFRWMNSLFVYFFFGFGCSDEFPQVFQNFHEFHSLSHLSQIYGFLIFPIGAIAMNLTHERHKENEAEDESTKLRKHFRYF